MIAIALSAYLLVGFFLVTLGPPHNPKKAASKISLAAFFTLRLEL
jgi:hypothetical protein